MQSDEARALFASARVARLATTDGAGDPHLVVICFALAGDTLHTAIDRKPKRSGQLKRIANVLDNPRVSLLVDHYEDTDWSRLWWVRADGKAQVIDPADPAHERAISLLRARYPQYREEPPAGPAIAVSITRWSGWRAAPA